MFRARELGAIAFLAFIGAAHTLGCAAPSGRSPASASERDHPMVGAPAPDFDLPDRLGSQRVSLAALKGKVVVVDFWATWCEPCRVSFPKYEGLVRRYAGRVVVVGVSEDDDPEGIAAFAEEAGTSFALAWDEDKSVARAYGPTTMPTSYLVDGQGLVRYVHTGFRAGDEEVIASELEGLLQ